MKIVLGSQSPRRKQLLEALGYHFEVRVKDTDESYPNHLKVEDVPVYIAQQKAKALISELNSNELLITADTIVEVENEILGKPTDAEDAKRMLLKLSNKTHRVISGVVLTTLEKQVTTAVITYVTFSELSIEMIDHYIAQYKPFDKAGSYGIQEWIGLVGVAKIEGSYTNVVGLPTSEVARAIENFKH